jgi:hypothetical protein
MVVLTGTHLGGSLGETDFPSGRSKARRPSRRCKKPQQYDVHNLALGATLRERERVVERGNALGQQREPAPWQVAQ